MVSRKGPSVYVEAWLPSSAHPKSSQIEGHLRYRHGFKWRRFSKDNELYPTFYGSQSELESILGHLKLAVIIPLATSD